MTKNTPSSCLQLGTSQEEKKFKYKTILILVKRGVFRVHHQIHYGTSMQSTIAIILWYWCEVVVYGLSKVLEGALNSLALPLETAVPLLPGQVWPFFYDRFLVRIGVGPSLHPRPLPPSPRNILCSRSRPQVYHGSMAAHDWFQENFATLDAWVTPLTLVT